MDVAGILVMPYSFSMPRTPFPGNHRNNDGHRGTSQPWHPAPNVIRGRGLPVDGDTLCRGKTYRLRLWMKTRDADRLAWELPTILHNAFRAPDGSEAVIAVNVTDAPQTGTLRWGGRQIAVELAPWKARLIEAPK